MPQVARQFGTRQRRHPKGLVAKVDPQQLGVLQKGKFDDDVPDHPQHALEQRTPDQEHHRVNIAKVLKDNLVPLPVGSRSTPQSDRVVLYRKLDKSDLSVLERFLTVLDSELAKRIRVGESPVLDPSDIARLQDQYQNISI